MNWNDDFCLPFIGNLLCVPNSLQQFLVLIWLVEILRRFVNYLMFQLYVKAESKSVVVFVSVTNILEVFPPGTHDFCLVYYRISQLTLWYQGREELLKTIGDLLLLFPSACSLLYCFFFNMLLTKT